MSNEYIDLTRKKSILSVIGDKVVNVLMVIGVIALVIGGLNMANDGKSEIEIRAEQTSQR
jgi:Ca2+/Na+ antiporter